MTGKLHRLLLLISMMKKGEVSAEKIEGECLKKILALAKPLLDLIDLINVIH